MKVRVSKHQDVLKRTGELVKWTFKTSVRAFMLMCGH